MEPGSDDPENETDETGPTHSVAIVAAETLMSWLEKQNLSSPTQLILLKLIKDLAAKKRTTTASQTCPSHGLYENKSRALTPVELQLNLFTNTTGHGTPL
ncbi:hypothetical protein J6590_069676 [Homalodisca vitripennis]|nr:hypothetical protein J6590_069676 [Homalodisca vitripennis]